MHLIENIREGLRAIQGNLLRTILTGLIISLGIMSLIGILTAVDSIKQSVNQTFSSLGANSFDIRNRQGNRMHSGGKQQKIHPPITFQEALQYKKRSRTNTRVSLSTVISGSAVVKGNGKKTNPNSRVVGGDENYLLNENKNLESGRGFSNVELENGVNVAILGSEIAKKLFEKRNPVGKDISMMGQRYKVVGVLEKSGSTMGGGADRMVLIPLLTANRLPRDFALTYNIKTAILSTENLMYAMGEATGLMRQIRRDPLGQEDSFEITRSDSLVKTLDSISGNLRIGGFIIGFITLLGASIGLMNIMMVSVTERTREIGVRKALGATMLQIRQQFLIDAIVICVLGGSAGIILGIVMGNLVATTIGEGSFYVPWLWVMVGLVVCIVVGLVSGYYPAYKASKLDPIESLRYE
ncbi:MAG: ABC transporter permease [Hymenobacteraceae bacterium]|nr:ABC transporter permease [Hymenobacteraceae bacterium]MDX5395791.1 ABC transporter permease [Hymenobacteraceae bacterium]MDX5511846.1 ABC transporter permease [Hymenobacteraceae bacterium]